jgi:ABC-2 type transport system permease protein
MTKIKGLLLGDAMLPFRGFKDAWDKYLSGFGEAVFAGDWEPSWEKLQFWPLLVVTPLTFLGGAFYSIDMLPPLWRRITLFNPVVHLISGFRWSFFGHSDVNVAVSLSIIALLLLVCLAVIARIFHTGWRLRH